MLDLGNNDDLGILLSMVYAAWADGNLSSSELDLILAEAADQGLDQPEQRALRDALLDRPPADAIAAKLTTRDARRAAWFAAHATIWADDRLELAELEALGQLATAFGLSDRDQEEVSSAARETFQKVRAGNWDDALLLERQLLDPS